MLAEDISPAEIRQKQSERSDMRSRDLADMLGISEAEYLCAWLGDGTRCITCRPEDVFPKLVEVGPLMALTRNASAVHETIGFFERFSTYRTTAECHGPGIRTHLTSQKWVHGFSVEKRQTEKRRDEQRMCSFQFFDANGTAVHKIHTRPDSNFRAWDRIAEAISLDIDAEDVRSQLQANRGQEPGRVVSSSGLETMFEGCKSNLEFHRVSNEAIEHMLNAASAIGLPLICKVSSTGCLQTYEGPVAKIVTMGPWINIMDDQFHMHLRKDHLIGTYIASRANGAEVRTSLEAYDASGKRVIYFVNQDDGTAENESLWQKIIHELPKP